MKILISKLMPNIHPHSLIAAGFGLSISSFQLAVSTYFLEKRNKAIGVGMSVAGIGDNIIVDIDSGY